MENISKAKNFDNWAQEIIESEVKSLKPGKTTQVRYFDLDEENEADALERALNRSLDSSKYSVIRGKDSQSRSTLKIGYIKETSKKTNYSLENDETQIQIRRALK